MITTPLTNDSSTLHSRDLTTIIETMMDGRYIIYNPATDRYLRINRSTDSSGLQSIFITWEGLSIATSFKEHNVNSILDTFWCTGGWKCGVPHEEVDLRVTKGFRSLLDNDVIGSIGELQLVPIVCEFVKDNLRMVPIDCEYVNDNLRIVGIDFTESESILG